MTGYIKLYRGYLDHELFAKEPYTEREAFLYLIEQAAWKDRYYRTGNAVYPLKRGQLTASLRYLAQAWQWNKNRVAGFIKFLTSADMIKTENGTGQNVISVCNYSKYQDDIREPGTVRGQCGDSAGTVRGQCGDKTEEVKKLKKDKKRIVEREENAPKEINKSSSKSKTGKRIDAEFKTDRRLPEDYRTFAESEGHLDPSREWEKFFDYWLAKAGAGEIKRDWFAAWRNWVRKSVERQGATGFQNKQTSAREADRIAHGIGLRTSIPMHDL